MLTKSARAPAHDPHGAAVLDLFGGTAIPSGSGLILEIALGQLAGAATGEFTFSIANGMPLRMS